MYNYQYDFLICLSSWGRYQQIQGIGPQGLWDQSFKISQPVLKKNFLHSYSACLWAQHIMEQFGLNWLTICCTFCELGLFFYFISISLNVLYKGGLRSLSPSHYCHLGRRRVSSVWWILILPVRGKVWFFVVSLLPFCFILLIVLDITYFYAQWD
jgi:hypothetical protein